MKQDFILVSDEVGNGVVVFWTPPLDVFLAKNLDEPYTVFTMNEENDLKIEKDEDLDDSVIAEESTQEMVKNLREKLKKTLAEKQEYLNNWQRDKAEFLNARKRDQEVQKDFTRFSNENLISELIPVLDSFSMAMGNKETWEKADKGWRVGVEYIANQLKKTLENFGLKEIDPIGKPFDPMRDEAIEHEQVTDEKKNHTVTFVIQKGYELNGKVLKAPKVKVGEFISP
ncbi:MAG: nucleotide exchange factor GrpE [Patescibacteria group bacterium]